MIGIIDYDSQNANKLVEIVKGIGVEASSGHDVEELRKSSHIILPNAQSFEQAMARLKEWQLLKELPLLAKENVPILGIGMGMNIMMEGCTEAGFTEGLSLIEGVTEPMLDDANFPLPHQNWSKLIVVDELEEVSQKLKQSEMYFNHSLQVDCELENIVALSQYGMKFPSIIKEKNRIGFQFLPEESGEIGMQALISFLQLGGNTYGFSN